MLVLSHLFQGLIVSPIVLDDDLAKRRPQYSHLLRHNLSYDAAFQMASSGVHRENIQLSQKLCGATFLS